MLFRDYIPLAQRTNPDLGSAVLNSVHMCLGFASETYELVEAEDKKDTVNVGEEIADKLWYLAGYIFINNVEFSMEFVSNTIPVHVGSRVDSSGASMVFFESMLLDYDKKWLAYGKEKDAGMVKNAVVNLFMSYNNFIVAHNLNASTIMSNNIDKLRVRFPDKFTTEAAINRDTASERVELEK